VGIRVCSVRVPARRFHPPETFENGCS
jgi:hypothetical protein